MSKPLKISEEAAVQMPMKTIVSLIVMVAIGTWAYFGIGINEAMPEVGKLIKVNTYPDPYWLLPIQGKMVRLETKQLYQQQLLGEKLLAH